MAKDIEVKPPPAPGVTDTDIAYAVRRTLEWDVSVPAERIRMTVSGGVVTLEGTVDALREREDAERAIRRLVRVRGITNTLVVQAPEVEVDAQAVQDAIEAALERQAEREARHLTVQVRDASVTVSGRVCSWAEKRAVRGVVSHAPGVRAVEYDLRIEPSA